VGVRAQGTAELKTSDYQTGSYVSVLTLISIEILKKNLCRTTAVDATFNSLHHLLRLEHYQGTAIRVVPSLSHAWSPRLQPLLP